MLRSYNVVLGAIITDDYCSIVFSCWTRSLDLVEHYLKVEKIQFARIDGSCTLHQRQSTLDTYHTDPEICILLMTTGTGAVG